ncbi:hypothetical protein BDQ17DRAFT_1360508 [Cyathus striatus]|nr:hypothetical protein BDQ17DRAFT_1360508 [Cyathus striatus]
MSISPPDDVVKSALVSLKAENPTLGISKIHALLLSTHPDWTVSEKRTRKILQSEGLVVSPNPQGISIYPSSRIVRSLDLRRWTPKAEVKYFDKRKGKGLVATVDIEEGEAIWKEDPYALAPEWEIFEMQMDSTACSYCSTPLSDSPIITTCPASTSSSYCPARFCNRLCLSRSAKTHPLLCPAQNPASIPLIDYAKETGWMALHALAQCSSRLLLAAQTSDVAFEADWDVYRGFAELGMEERFKYSFRHATRSEPDRAAWKKGHQLFVQAFKDPVDPVHKKKLARILKKPLRPDVEKELFDYDAGFLRGLGKMSLNMEAHGGLYTVHSHLNHSCLPNVSVRHLDQRVALSRITLVAKRPIRAGMELLVTYVNPELRYRQRQIELEAWGFGTCACARCREDLKHMKPEELEVDDLANELKAGLGVM